MRREGLIGTSALGLRRAAWLALSALDGVEGASLDHSFTWSRW